MSPDLVKARWTADDGSAEIVLLDSGELRCRTQGIDMLIATPWDDEPQDEPSDPEVDP